MKLKEFLRKMGVRLNSTTYDEKGHRTIRTIFGHERTYDKEGYLISEKFRTSRGLVTNFYYPGTRRFQLRKKILSSRIDLENSSEFRESWFDIKRNVYAFVQGMVVGEKEKSTVVILRDNVPQKVTHEMLLQKRDEIFDLLDKRTDLVDYNLDEMAKLLSDRIVQSHEQFLQISKSTEATTKIEEQSKQQEKQLPDPEQKPVVENVQPKAELEQSKEPESAPKAAALTTKEKKDRWEDQLLRRMIKHDELAAKKEKIEASKRMSAERKVERLASVEKQIKQNEKAQAILKRKLAILEATQLRDDWKTFAKEERAEYKALSEDLKTKRTLVKTYPAADKEGRAVQSADLSQDRKLKQMSFRDYRTASLATKNSNITLRKLRDVKRQQVVFELSQIVQEMKALENALRTERDMFQYMSMNERLRQLRAQKREIVIGYRDAVQARKNAKQSNAMDNQPKQPVQALLPLDVQR